MVNVRGWVRRMRLAGGDIQGRTYLRVGGRGGGCIATVCFQLRRIRVCALLQIILEVYRGGCDDPPLVPWC